MRWKRRSPERSASTRARANTVSLEQSTKCWNCLSCGAPTVTVDDSNRSRGRRMYEPLSDMTRDKRRLGYDVIRPATTKYYASPLYGPRELPPAASTPIRPQSDVEENRLDPPVGHAQHPVSAFAMDARKQQGRRRSREAGSGRQLRSPAVQRPPTARVTLQGWLHKQGSEGLMLWKRRWFVLSEYCLFYYKGPEEEKLLGSILLPSYKVSPCAPDDRVFRKFCFKAEHQNMRTYFFAADSRELMVRWMNALSLASILQTDVASAAQWTGASPGQPSVSSISQSADDSDSGFHGFRSPRGGAVPGSSSVVTPRQIGDGSAQPPPSSTVPAVADTAPVEVNGWPPRIQPLYANAPPKPRRLTSSPDPSPDRAGSHQTPSPAAQQQASKEPEYGSRLRGYARNPYHFHAQINGPTERRTPDTYGRSNNVSRTDYEDVYAERYGVWPPPPPQAYLTEGYTKGHTSAQQQTPVDQAYAKNLSSQQIHADQAYAKNPSSQQIHVYQVEPNYGNKPQHGYLPDGTYAKGVYVKPTGPPRLEYNPITPPATLVKHPMPYPTFRMSSPAPITPPPPPQQQQQAPAVQTRPKPASGHPPRPHSADFLEKDTRHIPETAVIMRRERPGHPTERPKSSVDMYHEYWSEESYAQKMRQSLYMHARANTPLQRVRPPSLERGRTPTQQPPPPPSQQSPSNAHAVRRHEDQQQHSALSQQQNTRRYSEQAERLVGNNNQFIRSASARLPRQRGTKEEPEQQPETGPGSERKIQQREESMQRLLEWKQRMLQSPLTRKSSPRPHEAGAAPSPLSHLQLLRSAVDGPTTTVSEAGSSSRPRRQPSRGSANSSGSARSRSQDPGRRSAPPTHRRNSYSSDDEEVRRESSRGSRRTRRPTSSQAGRTGRQSASGVVEHQTAPPPPPPAQHQQKLRRSQPQVTAAAPTSLPSPDYVNVNALNERRERGPEKADNLSNELRQLSIPPDASYTDTYTQKTKKISPSSKQDQTPLLPGSKYDGDALNLGVGHFYPALGSKTAATHKLTPIPVSEDRSSNGKHSDSGYDTLRAQEAAEAKRSALRSPIINQLLCEPPDESRLIKEFSYEYIRGTTPENAYQKSLGRRQKQSPPTNPTSPVTTTVEGIIKKQDGLKMQEPLQPSQPIYHSNEAHVSSLKSPDRESEADTAAIQEVQAGARKTRQNTLRTFAFGESSPEDQTSPRAKEVTSSNPRSVRELLADFERKSAALAKEQLQAEQDRTEGQDAAGRRCVFSDTETLLYDTSSDAELPATEEEPSMRRLHAPRRCVSRAGDRSEDEDDDAEVAAALGRRDKFFSACRDLGRRKDASAGIVSNKDGVNIRKRKIPRGKPPADVEDVIVTPGYLRLSLAESMVAHEDSASSRSSPSPNPPISETRRVKTPETAVSEEHYMPMTPSRRPVLAPPSANCMILEESSYVEMAEDGGVRNLTSVFHREELRRLNSGGSSGTYAPPESPPYCELNHKQEKNGEDSSGHYEFLYHATTKYEPVYMEVKQLDGLKPLGLGNKQTGDNIKCKEIKDDGGASTSADKMSTLPDILNTTNTSTSSQQSKPEDSDDADDEASKDLDSLDTPRHPRFSLSDTFRPASYYLGASECAPEQHDSSDSDLVSPPPIPTSPPPLDDELDDDFPLDLRKTSSSSHSTQGPLSENKKFSDRSASQADKKSLQGSLDGSTVSDTLTDSSRLKRRPVSEEMLDSLDETSFLMNSLSESSVATTCKDMSATTSRFSLEDEMRARDALLGYPKDLTYGFSEAAYHKESFQQRENMYATNKPSQKDNKSDMLILSSRVRFTSEEQQQQHATPPPVISPDSILIRARHIRSSSLEEALNSNLDRSQLPPTPPSTEESSAQQTTAQTVLLDSSAESAGAPYYYSDLLRGDEDGFASSASELSISRLPPPPMQPPLHSVSSLRSGRFNQLNNQRGETIDPSKRNDIGRKVNPIISAQQPTRVEEVDMTRIAAEIRTTTAKTVQPVDSRNIYEADTLRKMARRRQQQYEHRRRSQTPDPDLETRNLYPQGLRDKSDALLEPRRRSRSLEGLLDDEDDGFLDAPRLPPQAGPQERRRRSSGAPARSRSTNPSEGSDPWEEDVLWRESLRRVSLRHTRSLDDLDDDDTSPAAPGPSRAPPSGRRSVDMLSTTRERVTPRVSREVTYVNDVAARNRMLRTKRELYESDYRIGRRHGGPGSFPPPPPPPPPSVPQEEEDTGVYEKLARTSESLERSRRGQTYVEGYEWDVDRETFRQGEQSQTLPPPPQQHKPKQQHFLEESLPPSFEIDREKLRQWDLLSSAPLEGGTSTVGTASTISTRPVGSEGMREGSMVASSVCPSVIPHPPLQEEAAGLGGRHLDLATQPLPPQPPPPQQGGRGEPPPPPPSLEGSGSGSMRDSLPAPRGSGGRHLPQQQQQQQRASPMSSQQQQALLQAGMSGHPGSMAGGGGGTGAGPGSRGASPQRLMNGGHTAAGHVNEMPDESSNTSDSELMRKPPPPPPPPSGPAAETSSWPPSNGSVSAGELLGRTHEELVLLLIQLRRQSAALRHAAELCRTDVLGQARLAEIDAARRTEHLRRLEELKRHLQEIEKQYEKGKPLVHLVDNMVKLGSLYRGPSAPHSLPRATCTPPPLQRLEFNLQVQEQRLLAEERRDWNRLSPPDHSELQAKVQQLYRLDRLLQEESVTIQNLQQDKALLERALGGLRHKLAGSAAGPEAERYRRQQRLLERELSRVRHLLAANSKKLEETVAENARLEHELVLLRQKLQAARSTSPVTAASPLHSGGSTVALEQELRRVQSLVGDLQRQRQDLSAQVRQLTEKSQTLAQQIRPTSQQQSESHHHPSSNKQQRGGRPAASWLETDLDSLHTQDVGRGESPSSRLHLSSHQQDPRAPLYVNTDALEGSGYGTASRSEDTGTSEELSPPPPPPAPESAAVLNGGPETYEPQDINEADERTKRFYGIIPRAEKPEIKTVRIVKRESERRSRVKRPTTLEGDLGRVVEEDTPPPPSELELSLLLELQREHEQQAAVFQRSLSLPRGFGKQPPPPPPPIRAPSPRGETGSMRTYTARYRPPSPEEQRPMSAHAQLFGGEEEASPAEGSSSSGPVSPVYQSEAARAIVQEMTRRRAIPKTKRRHHTVAGRLQQALLPSGSTGARARDDLDMERALRRRVAGAPDVVRSTLSHRELKYNEGTIDSILGTPNKILIPERYVPEQEPELTAEEQLHRLKKAESIRKMLSETTPISAPETQPSSRNGETNEEDVPSTMKLKLAAEKRQREHLLQLNQLLAQQVMEKSKIVAVRALETTRKEPSTTDDDDLSPVTPLPLVQQRDNFYS